MSDNLTTLIAKIQPLLGDDGTIFTTATCTAAVRQALSEWNMRAPQFLGTLITGVNNQYEYEITDADSGSLDVIDVKLQGTDTAHDINTSLSFDQYIENERVFIRLRSPITTSETLIINYTKPHTISGLDSATETTIADRWNQAMIDGGAFFAIFIRAVSRVESINLSKDQSDNYRDLAGYFGSAFAQRLALAARRRKPAVSEPDSRTWSDNYSSWDQ